jgi:hypothetical protein
MSEPTQTGAVAEEWTYGGTNSETGKDRRAIWYDKDRNRWYFSPDKGTHPVVGCVYTVKVARTRKEDGKESLTRWGIPIYVGRQEDGDWAAALQVSAHAADLEAAAGQMERRAAKDTELDQAIKAIERIAANVPYAHRAALIELVTNRIYRARKTD